VNGSRITRETKGGLGVQRHFVFLYLSFFSPVSFLTLTYVNFLPASITRLLRNRFSISPGSMGNSREALSQ